MTPVLLLLSLSLAPTASPRQVETAPMARPTTELRAALQTETKPITPDEVLAAALADAQKLPPEIVKETRYFDARALMGEKSADYYGVLCYQINALSREVEQVKPRKVTPWLWAVCLSDYRLDHGTWENLAKYDPYYHIPVKIVGKPEKPADKPASKTERVLQTDGTYIERPIKAEAKTTEKEKPKADAPNDFIPAPWLAPKLSADLGTLVNSKCPIVRADQFVYLSGAQVDRAGVGYYDWLGFTKRTDVEKLAKLNRKDAEEIYRELAAIVPVSQIALNNRQVFRLQALTGGWWETRDTKSNLDDRNATARLLDDFKHDAEEIVFTLPNRLPGFYLSDAEGKQIESAPDFIAADNRSTNNDRRVHVGYSCIACHSDAGLRPLRDYSRKIYNEDTGVSLAALSLDPAKAKRLRSVYLGPLAENYDQDTSNFAKEITKLTGLKPPEFAKAYESLWSHYLDDPVSLEKAAIETGYPAATIKTKLREYAATKKLVDPVLVVYLMDDPVPVRREHFEERFSLLMLILAGGNP